MNYNVIIRALSEEEKIAGNISDCSAIQILCIHANKIKGSCTTCLLRSVGCTSLNDPEKITELAELIMLWEQENPAPVWSYKDEFFKRNPDADADVKGYPTCLRQRVFKNAHLIGKKNLSPTEEWDEPYIDANFEIAATTEKTLPANTPEKQYNIKDLKELNEHLLERLTQYQPEFFQGHLGSYAQFCINSIRKTIDIRFGLRLSSGTKKLNKAELNGYARAIDEILPELY